MEFIEACKKIISIDSSPSMGTGEVCEFLKKMATDMGYFVAVETDVLRGLPQSTIMCASEKLTNEFELILQSHLDTPDPGPFSAWKNNSQNPFLPTIHSGNLFGLGVSCAKIDFVCKLFAAQEFIKKPTSKPFLLLGTYGEEDLMRGAERLLRKKTIRAKYALIGEATNLEYVNCGSGYSSIEITIPFSDEEVNARNYHNTYEGQSTQSKIFKAQQVENNNIGYPANALENLFQYLVRLPDKILILDIDGGTSSNTTPIQAFLEFDIFPMKNKTISQKIRSIYEHILVLKTEFKKYLDPRFSPPNPTLQIGMARTFSDHFKIMGCVWWPQKLSPEIYQKWFDRLKSHCEKNGAVFRLRDFRSPFYTEKDSPFCEKIREADKSAEFFSKSISNEASVFEKHGIQCLAMGPGQHDLEKHIPEERVKVDDLRRAVQVYKRLIDKICFS